MPRLTSPRLDCSYSPPDEEDAEAGDQSVGEDVGSVRV